MKTAVQHIGGVWLMRAPRCLFVFSECVSSYLNLLFHCCSFPLFATILSIFEVSPSFSLEQVSEQHHSFAGRTFVDITFHRISF